MIQRHDVRFSRECRTPPALLRYSVMENFLSNPLTYNLILGAVTAIGALMRYSFKAGERQRGVHKDTSSFETIARSVEATLSNIELDLKELSERIPVPIVKGSSRLSLTEFGKEVSREINAKDWARSKSQTLWRELDGKEPYEIHDFCENYVLSEVNVEAIEGSIKRTIYEHGSKRDDLMSLLAIELRDSVLRALQLDDE